MRYLAFVIIIAISSSLIATPCDYFGSLLNGQGMSLEEFVRVKTNQISLSMFEQGQRFISPSEGQTIVRTLVSSTNSMGQTNINEAKSKLLSNGYTEGFINDLVATKHFVLHLHEIQVLNLSGFRFSD